MLTALLPFPEAPICPLDKTWNQRFQESKMPRVKLTKTLVAGAQPQEVVIELRDTLVPGFFCKITPTGRKFFMLQYRSNSG